jgi:cell division protein FtsN
MRRVRSDVSHRIRRQPSIFSAGWFRVCLGAGVVLVLALLLGPWVAGWFGSDLPRSLFLLAPWSSDVKATQLRPSEPVIEKPGVVKPSAPAPPPPLTAPRGTASATSKPPGPTADGQAPSAGRVVAGGPSTPAASKSAAPAAPPAPPRETPKAGPAPEAAPAKPGALTALPAVYWVQVGAFLEHRNAEKLVERLRGDGLPASTTAFEQSRVLYRVLLTGPEGGPVPSEAVERVRGLGHQVETTADGPAVTGPVALRKAVETSHALRQQGVQVRLKQEVSSSTYRVVRVGSFSTVAEAETALATLTSKGVEGIVVRER